MIPQRYLLVAATFWLAVLLYFDRICISVAKEPVTAELKLTEQQFGWVLSSFAIGYALFQTPMGMTADRFGPRVTLSAVVTLWSIFTGLTGVVRNLWVLLGVRFLFGAGEAGAFPGTARATYSWIPMGERGMVQGIIFSGGRLGGAIALPLMPWMIQSLGWRQSFLVLMLIGFVWSVAWIVWFRDDPAQQPGMSESERDFILRTRQQAGSQGNVARPPPVAALIGSVNMWLLMVQYFCGNFTFFFCLSWMFPHLKKTYALDPITAGWYSAVPLVFGALGNIVAGLIVDFIYRRGHWTWSRRLPATLGFVLAAAGMIGCAFASRVEYSVAWLALAVLGADMTLAPSWAVCVDIGKRASGAVSGTMNMAGNIGSAINGIAFPYLVAWTGSHVTFFYVAAGLNVLAVVLWLMISPKQPLVKEQANAA
jgi:ACS family glucarate transporter-like MFS transporter